MRFLSVTSKEEIKLRGRTLEEKDFGRVFPLDTERLFLRYEELIELDMSTLSQYQQLKQLYLSDNKLATIDLAPLSNCQELREVYLSRNPLRTLDLSPLAKCPHLRKMYISDTLISQLDLSPLKHCSELEVLYLSGNRLVELDLSPLRNSLHLKYLHLSDNRLSKLDLNPLSYCQNLQEIILSNNRLHDLNLAPLGIAKRLKSIDLRFNQLCKLDITPLISNQLLESFLVTRNPTISQDDILRIHILISPDEPTSQRPRNGLLLVLSGRRKDKSHEWFMDSHIQALENLFLSLKKWNELQFVIYTGSETISRSQLLLKRTMQNNRVGTLQKLIKDTKALKHLLIAPADLDVHVSPC